MKASLLWLGLGAILTMAVAGHTSHRIRNPRTSILHRSSILQNLAVDRMLRDRGLVMSVINCVLDKAPCDSHGRHLKRLVPEVIRGRCPGCDRNVKKQVRRVITHVQRNFPQQWTEVMHRFLHSVQHPSHFFG